MKKEELEMRIQRILDAMVAETAYAGKSEVLLRGLLADLEREEHEG